MEKSIVFRRIFLEAIIENSGASENRGTPKRLLEYGVLNLAHGRGEQI